MTQGVIAAIGLQGISLAARRVCNACIYIMVIACGLLVGAAQAQIQRSIVNPSFEQPFTGTRAAALAPFFSSVNWIAVDAGEIPGWETTHPIITNGCPVGGGITPAYTCTPIELWANSYNGVTPAQGIILAELNAYQNSKLYQNICMTSGETFTFNFAHRGRGGPDQARLEVGTATISTVLDFTTNTTGTGTINAGGGATGTSATGIANGWTRYAGSYVYTGASGVQRLGFSAVTPIGGIGNLLDDLNISLKPYIEFIGNAGSSVEGGAASPPQFKVVGTVPAGGATLTLSVGGTATFNTDYNYSGTTTLTGVTGTATSVTVTVPAGNYSDATANNIFTLPIVVLNDTVIEDNETLIITMPANTPASPFVNANTTTCGGTTNSVYTHTIIDNDIDVTTTKTVSPTGTQALGTVLSYTITYENVTPITPTIAPLTAHDANAVTISDPAPAGVTLGAWTCVGAGGAVCPAASGSGALTGTVNLPVGSKLTYTLAATLSSNTLCGTTATNTSTIGTVGNTATSPSGAALTEGASVQGNAGYVFKANSASASNAVPPCAALSITKTNNRSAVQAGDVVTYDIVVSNAGPSAANGTVLTDPAVPGQLNCTAVSCTAVTGAAVCPAAANVTVPLLQGAGVVLPTFPANSSVTFQLVCTVL
jgi:uncharacterized repeat protein (TIGR01451 family)